jgi:hypothetical protein
MNAITSIAPGRPITGRLAFNGWIVALHRWPDNDPDQPNTLPRVMLRRNSGAPGGKLQCRLAFGRQVRLTRQIASGSHHALEREE